MTNPEQKRLDAPAEKPVSAWLKWGPYVSERSWGTVREDYSWNGDAWNFFPWDMAAAKVYRWGEEGIAGWCDRYQVLVFAPAFWNGKDPLLKENLFGLSNEEGNHAEDVKEYYYHLDGTPTHSYMKYLYKYPQAEFPYQKLREENRKRSLNDPEYELIDTGVFAENRYFDIFIEYAKNEPEDICVRIEICNRANEEATLHVIPQLWFRNQWSWGEPRLSEPIIHKGEGECLVADDTNMPAPTSLSFDYHLGKRYLYGPDGGEILFTNNESKHLDITPYVKNAFHRRIVNDEKGVCAPNSGTKACFHYTVKLGAKSSHVLHLRLTNKEMKDALHDVEKIVQKRKKEADEFYEAVQPKHASSEEKLIQRQAIAGMLWSKQIYLFDVNVWLNGDKAQFPPPQTRQFIRNHHWRHLNSMRILSMPDKWEYPWFAAWDLAFHTLTYGLVDIEFAKEQLWLLLFDQFQHPNGQIPAYEWEFSDSNPPVQAWAAWRLYCMEKEKKGKGDLAFLKKCYLRLLMNFSWWVNKVDSSGNNLFEGGFLGLDNISIIDRLHSFGEGTKLEQSDGTGWMAMFCLNLMRISLELSKEDANYEILATKFFQHFVYIAHSMKRRGYQHFEMWSEKDGFFYDAISLADGSFTKFRVRSLVGVIPLFAVETLTLQELDAFPEFKRDFLWFLEKKKYLVTECVARINDHYLFSLVDKTHLARALDYIWSPDEFRSPYGLRSLSKIHEKNPFHFRDKSIGYEPGEAQSRVKGGNSNWRGPIWMPTNYFLIKALKTFHSVYKEDLKIGFGAEEPVTLLQMAEGFSKRLCALFKKGENNRRVFWGDHDFSDPHWADYLFFNEYFHADTGKGLGATHQTGWTGLIANLIDESSPS